MGKWNREANSNTGESKFETPPAGNHPAVLVAIIDMGTQCQEFNGEEKWQERAYFVWELVTKKQEGFKDRNHLVAIDLTVSLNVKSKLRQWIEARSGRKIRDGEDYDISQELGKPCLLNVLHTAKGYAKIEGVSSVPDGFTVPPPQNTPVIIDLDQFKAGTPIPAWVPWLFGKQLSDHIRECKELTSGGQQAASPPPPASPPPVSPPPPAVAPAATNGAPTRNGPPPRQGAPTKTAPVKYWIDYGNECDPELGTLPDLQAIVGTDGGRGLDLNLVKVCREGEETWKTLFEVEPAAKNWSPF